jgi:hypothetical protein
MHFPAGGQAIGVAQDGLFLVGFQAHGEWILAKRLPFEKRESFRTEGSFLVGSGQ